MNISTRFLCSVVKFNNFKVVKNIPRQSAAFRFYSRDAEHRVPVKVYKPDGESEWMPENDGATASYQPKQLRFNPEKRVIELAEDELENVSDDEVDGQEKEERQGTKFTQLSKAHAARFVTSVNRTQARKQRTKSGLIMLEGKRLIQDAILADVIPVEIFFSRKKLVEDIEMPPGVVELFQIPYRTIQQYSPLKTPPGIVAFCKMPKEVARTKTNKEALPISIICDNIRDPGNLGGIIRTVAAVGCANLILTEGCADLWNPNVLRAGSGAHFRMNIKNCMSWTEISRHVPPNSRVFLADSSTNTVDAHDCDQDTVPVVPYYSVDFSAISNHIVVVIGGETHGLSDDAKLMARYRDGVRINVPVENQVDSLSVNAAVSCILFEIKRQFVMDSAASRNGELLDQGISRG